MTVSKDGAAYVWSIKDGARLCQLEWTPPKTAKYLFKRCRFSSDGQRSRLLTITNPVGSTKVPAFLQLWDTSSFLLVNSVAHPGALSALSVSPDGNFVAVGSMSGGMVDVYTAFNLQLVHHVENAHSNFITGLEFVPCHTTTGRDVTGDSELAVISISVDNQIRIHRVARRRWLLPLWLALLLIIGTVTAAFVFCSWMGL